MPVHWIALSGFAILVFLLLGMVGVTKYLLIVRRRRPVNLNQTGNRHAQIINPSAAELDLATKLSSLAAAVGIELALGPRGSKNGNRQGG